jgi:hypothetical protein
MADLVLTDQFPAIGLAKAPVDLVKQVQSIQGIFDSGVIRQVLNCLQYLLLRFHDNSPIPLRILALTGHRNRSASSIGSAANDLAFSGGDTAPSAACCCETAGVSVSSVRRRCSEESASRRAEPAPRRETWMTSFRPVLLEGQRLHGFRSVRRSNLRPSSSPRNEPLAD